MEERRGRGGELACLVRGGRMGCPGLSIGVRGSLGLRCRIPGAFLGGEEGAPLALAQSWPPGSRPHTSALAPHALPASPGRPGLQLPDPNGQRPLGRWNAPPAPPFKGAPLSPHVRAEGGPCGLPAPPETSPPLSDPQTAPRGPCFKEAGSLSTSPPATYGAGGVPPATCGTVLA